MAPRSRSIAATTAKAALSLFLAAGLAVQAADDEILWHSECSTLLLQRWMDRPAERPGSLRLLIPFNDNRQIPVSLDGSRKGVIIYNVADIHPSPPSAILAMAAYGDYETLCPNQTFTQDAMLKNFPNSTLVPWEVLETFGPTEHGAEGFTVMIPEMAKVVLVFKGDYTLEKTLPTDVTSFDTIGLGSICEGCTVNNYAAQGYLEAVEATNNFEKARARWEETGLWFSITGHGLGGMHSIVASLVLGQQNISKFTHSYGAPRTLNPAGAELYDYMYGGDMTERGIANGDSFVELIPAGDDYSFTNTPFLYTGYNATYKMNMNICYEQPESEYCAPVEPLDEVDHYFYFANVGQCGGADKQDTSVGSAFIASQTSGASATATDSAATPTYSIIIGNATNPGPVTASGSSSASTSVASSSSSGASSTAATATSTSTSSSSSSGIQAAAAAGQDNAAAASESTTSSSASSTSASSAASRTTVGSLVGSGLMVAAVAVLVAL